MQRVGFAQSKRRNLRIEAFSGYCRHLIRAVHRPKRRGQWAPRGILKRLSRREYRLFSNNAWSLYFFHFAVRVRDDPVTANELYRFRAFVGNPYGIQEKPLLLIWA